MISIQAPTYFLFAYVLIRMIPLKWNFVSEKMDWILHLLTYVTAAILSVFILLESHQLATLQSWGSIVLIGFFIFGHLIYWGRIKEYRKDYGLRQVLFATACTYTISSSDVANYLLSIPLLILLSQTLLKGPNGFFNGEDIKTLISKTVFFEILIAASVLLFHNTSGHISIAKIMSQQISANHEAPFYFAFALIFFVFFSLMLIHPLDDIKVESHRQWLQSSFVKSGLSLVSTLVLVKWILIYSYRLKIYEWKVEAVGNESGLNILISVIFFLLLFNSVQHASKRGLQRVISYLSTQPLLFILLGACVGRVEATVWAALGLLGTWICVHHLSSTFSDLKLSPNASLHEYAEQVALFKPRSKAMTFFAFVLCTPIANPYLFQMLNVANNTWTSLESGGLHNLGKVILTICAMISTFLLTGLYVLETFGAEKKDSAISDKSPILLKKFDFVWLIPIILLGIYFTPLYKYILSGLSGPN